MKNIYENWIISRNGLGNSIFIKIIRLCKLDGLGEKYLMVDDVYVLGWELGIFIMFPAPNRRGLCLAAWPCGSNDSHLQIF